MKDIKCAQCGLINWAIEEKCLRCGRALAAGGPDADEAQAEAAAVEDDEQAHPAHEPPPADGAPADPYQSVCGFCGTTFKGAFCTLCRKPVAPVLSPRERERAQTFSGALFSSAKAKVGVSLLVGFIVVASVAAYRGMTGVSAAASEAYLTDLIKGSLLFKQPVTLSLMKEGRGDLAPGVEVLQEIGLASFTTGTLQPKQKSSLSFFPGREPAREQASSPAPPPQRFSRVELTEQGLKESAGWEPINGGIFTGTVPGVAGWRIPVGEREFVSIKKISLPIPNVYTMTNVEFTWRWKPNRAGKHFDVNSEEFKTLSPRAQQSATACPFSDSTKIYNGMATMTYEENVWGVSGIEFNRQPQ